MLFRSVWWWVGFRFAGGAGAGAGAAAVVVIVGMGFVDDIVSVSGEEQRRVCKIRGRCDRVLSQISCVSIACRCSDAEWFRVLRKHSQHHTLRVESNTFDRCPRLSSLCSLASNLPPTMAAHPASCLGSFPLLQAPTTSNAITHHLLPDSISPAMDLALVFTKIGRAHV